MQVGQAVEHGVTHRGNRDPAARPGKLPADNPPVNPMEKLPCQ